MNQDMNNQNPTPINPVNPTNINGVQPQPAEPVQNQMTGMPNTNQPMPTSQPDAISPQQLNMMGAENNVTPQTNIISEGPQASSMPQMNIQQPEPAPAPTPINNGISNLISQNSEQPNTTNGLPNQPVNNVQNTNTYFEPEKEKKKVPVLVIIAIICIIFAAVYYFLIYPTMFNNNNNTNTTPVEETTTTVTTTWDKYASLRTGDLGTQKTITGAYRILSDDETYITLTETEFTIYQSKNNLSDNYTQGTLTVSKGKEAANNAGLDTDSIISDSEGLITEDDFYTLTMNTVKEVTNGEEKIGLNQDYTQVWILKSHGTEGIESQVINIDQPVTTYYVKVSD